MCQFESSIGVKHVTVQAHNFLNMPAPVPLNMQTTSNTAYSMPPAKTRLSPSGSTVSMLLYATWLLWTWQR